MTKIVVVGAGPIGSYAAKLLAENGFNVEIFEEHKNIGLPVQCTGLVTKEIFDFIDCNDSVVNKLNGVRVVAPNGKAVEIPLKEFVIDRQKLDSELARRAVDAGAKLQLGWRFVGLKDGKVILRQNNKIVEKKTDILIGADGPLSNVAKAAGIFGKRKFYFGQQARVRGKFNSKKFTTYFGKVAPDFFGWVVPESRAVARIGLASKENARDLFDKFVSKFGGRIIGRQAGLIPIFSPLRQLHICRRFAVANATNFSLPSQSRGRKKLPFGCETARAKHEMDIYLVGDAAGFVKATTGGGLIPGLKSAKILAGCVSGGKNYHAATRKLRLGLLAHSVLRRTLNNFSDKDYDALAQLISNSRIKQIISKTTREEPIKIVAKLAIAEPRMLKFILRFF